MGDLDWRSLIKPMGVDRWVDIGPLPLTAAAAEPVPPVIPISPPSSTGIETAPLTSPSPGLSKRTRADSGFVAGQCKKTRAPLSLLAMKESVGMSRLTSTTTSSVEEVPAQVTPAPAPSSQATIQTPAAFPLFSDALPQTARIAPLSGGHCQVVVGFLLYSDFLGPSDRRLVA